MNEMNQPKIEDVSPIKKKITFDVPWQDVKHELDAAYQKVGKTARIKGFRPGKVPRSMLEKFYRQDVEADVVANLVNHYYWDALQKNRIAAVSQPEIEQPGIEADKNFVFSATIEVQPQVEPVGYKELELEKQEPIVADAELEASLEQMRQMMAVLKNVDDERGVQKGDFVTISFEGALDGDKLPELKSENHLLEIGSGSFVPGFEDQLIDARKGTVKNIEVVFPENYQAAHLAGKNVAFTVDVKDIKIKELPDFDEKFLNNFGKYDSLEDLRADVRRGIAEGKKQRAETAFIRQISDKLLEKNVFDVPEAFVQQQIYFMVTDAKNRMVSEGMDPKKAEELAANYSGHFRDEATKVVKTTILLEKIAEKESISVTDEEVEMRIRELAMQRSQDYETYRKSLESDGLLENIRGEQINRKTYEFIEANSKVTVLEAGQIESGDVEQ